MEELIKLISPKYKALEEMPYRQGVIGIITNNRDQFLLVQMVTYGEGQWRFPGGGVDEGETHQQALLRELKEELDTDKFEIIKESTQLVEYDWPLNVVIDQIKNKNRFFRGQQQKQFLVNFVGETEDIKPDPSELRAIKWVDYNDLPSHFVFDNQWGVAEKTIKELLQVI